MWGGRGGERGAGISGREVRSEGAERMVTGDEMEASPEKIMQSSSSIIPSSFIECGRAGRGVRDGDGGGVGAGWQVRSAGTGACLGRMVAWVAAGRRP